MLLHLAFAPAEQGKVNLNRCVFKIIKFVNKMIVFTILQQAGVLEGDKNLKMKQELLAITPICKM